MLPLKHVTVRCGPLVSTGRPRAQDVEALRQRLANHLTEQYEHRFISSRCHCFRGGYVTVTLRGVEQFHDQDVAQEITSWLNREFPGVDYDVESVPMAKCPQPTSAHLKRYAGDQQ